jgi:hypothetical protein
MTQPPIPHRLAGYVRPVEAASVSTPEDRRRHLHLVDDEWFDQIRGKPDLRPARHEQVEGELIREWPWIVAGGFVGLLVVIFMLARAGVL